MRTATGPRSTPRGVGDHITGLAALAGMLAGSSNTKQESVAWSRCRCSAPGHIARMDLGLQMALGKVAGAEPRDRNQSPLMNPYRASDGRWFFFTGLEAERISARCAGRSVTRNGSTTSASPAPSQFEKIESRSSPSSTTSSPSAHFLNVGAIRQRGVWWRRCRLRRGRDRSSAARKRRLRGDRRCACDRSTARSRSPDCLQPAVGVPALGITPPRY